MTTEKPRTVDEWEDLARDLAAPGLETLAESLIGDAWRAAFALGAASRASPEEGRALPMPPPLTCRHNGPGAQRVTIFRECQCGDCSQVDVTDLALRSPPAPSEETRERCPKCSAFAMASVGGDAWRTCSRCHVSWTLEDRQSPAAPPAEDEGARAKMQRALEIVRLYCGDKDIDALRVEFEAIGGVDLVTPRVPASKEGGRHE